MMQNLSKVEDLGELKVKKKNIAKHQRNLNLSVPIALKSIKHRQLLARVTKYHTNVYCLQFLIFNTMCLPFNKKVYGVPRQNKTIKHS